MSASTGEAKHKKRKVKKQNEHNIESPRSKAAPLAAAKYVSFKLGPDHFSSSTHGAAHCRLVDLAPPNTGISKLRPSEEVWLLQLPPTVRYHSVIYANHSWPSQLCSCAVEY